MKISKATFIFPSILFFAFSDAETFKMQDKVIKAKISYQNLNRISVKGDKIDSILGIDNAFHFEKNDKTGEAFIRPTEDNGYTPISLSITTISGRTQDLLLEPVDGDANIIELISDFSENIENLSSLQDFSLQEESISSDYEENISLVMKKFINASSKLQSIDVTGVKDRTFQHLTAKFKSAYRIDGFLCLKFTITTEQEGRLDERMFSRSGDIALSLSGLSISEKGAATLYVLRK